MKIHVPFPKEAVGIYPSFAPEKSIKISCILKGCPGYCEEQPVFKISLKSFKPTLLSMIHKSECSRLGLLFGRLQKEPFPLRKALKTITYREAPFYKL